MNWISRQLTKLLWTYFYFSLLSIPFCQFVFIYLSPLLLTFCGCWKGRYQEENWTEYSIRPPSSNKIKSSTNLKPAGWVSVNVILFLDHVGGVTPVTFCASPTPRIRFPAPTLSICVSNYLFNSVLIGKFSQRVIKLCLTRNNGVLISLHWQTAQQGHIEFLEIIFAIVMGLFDLYQITKNIHWFVFPFSLSDSLCAFYNVGDLY